MKEKGKITLRLGELQEPLLARCQVTGQTEREVIRAALAKELGVEVPEMSAGNPNIAGESQKGVKARWGKRSRKKKS